MKSNNEKCPRCGKPLTECAKGQNRFGASFKEIREENNQTAEDFASILNVDVSEINEIENGSKRPAIEQITALAQNLNISPFEFTNRPLDKSKYFQKAS